MLEQNFCSKGSGFFDAKLYLVDEKRPKPYNVNLILDASLLRDPDIRSAGTINFEHFHSLSNFVKSDENKVSIEKNVYNDCFKRKSMLG